MIIDCISDLHGFRPNNLTGGDLLLLCGDYTARDSQQEWQDFFWWVKKQDYLKKIVIAGNHDGLLHKRWVGTDTEKSEYWLEYARDVLGFEFLCDSGTEFQGLKIWGSPWSVYFPEVNPACTYFMQNEVALAYLFNNIPADIDILMTHTPPYGVLDTNRYGECCGSTALRDHLDNRIKPKLHVFGHIHENYGKSVLFKNIGYDIPCYNVSYVNENYRPIAEVTSLIWAERGPFMVQGRQQAESETD